MLDLETWGTSPGCAIASLGAVFFDFGGRPLGPSYYANISAESCAALGLSFDQRVIDWWGQQSEEAQAALDTDQLLITVVLDRFTEFVEANDEPELCVWSHGATFDIPITDAALRAAGRQTPWKYHNGRDTRTLIWLAEQLGIATEWPHTGLRHYALDDAKSRALQMIALRQRIVTLHA